MPRSYFIFILSVFLLWPLSTSASILAPNQIDWLNKHNNTLIVRPEKNYPPFSFVSSGPSSRPKGLAVDYLELIARKVGAQSTYLDAKPRSTIISDLKAGKEGIVLALSDADDPNGDLYFSDPFVTIPAVIVTRKDFKHAGGEVTLADFNAKEVAITDGYAVSDYVRNNYQKIIIDPVSDDEVGLQKLLLGEVDAAVMDLASLSYYTSRDVLSYVTIAGQTGFEYKLAFAVPKTMPDLAIILNAGLKEITPSERSVISDRWITFQEQPHSLDNKFSFVATPLWTAISILAIIIITILLTIMIVHTRRHHALHVASVQRAHNLSDLKNQLHDLEDASLTLNENMQEIKSLEKTIQEKIENI